MFHVTLQKYMTKMGRKPKDFYNNPNPSLNISNGYFYKILRGDNLPSTKVIRKFAIILGLPPEWLVAMSAEACYREQVKHLRVLAWAIAACFAGMLILFFSLI